MKLGIIGGESEKDFQYVQSLGLSYIEFCINVGQNAFEHAARAEEIAGYSKKYGVAVSSVGRWGTERLLPDGTVNDEEYRSDLALIDMAAAVGCPVFVCGCNEVKEMSFIDNALLAADYFQKLVDYGAARGVRIAVYNCDWGNVIFDRRGWDIVLPKVGGLGIKYDTSHCINRGGDTLQEMLDYGKHFYHFHIKGTVRINGRHVDDPPAGMDMTPWGAVMDLLYLHDYKAVMSIEPHSSVWRRGNREDWACALPSNISSSLFSTRSRRKNRFEMEGRP